MNTARPRSFLALTVIAFAATLPAQTPIAEPIDAITKRFAEGGDLLAMQWRRDDSGRLLTRPKGAPEWQPLVHDDIMETVNTIGAVGFLMAWLQGDNDLLGMTDGARHLQRLGISTTDADLITFLTTKLPDAAAARNPAVLDCMIAIDLLRRRGVKSAVPNLTALAQQPGLPLALQQRANDAIAVLQGGTRAAPTRLDPATLPLPTVADGYLIFDNTRVPDMSRLADFGRRLGMASSLMVLRMLKAPTVEDLTVAQAESDAIGELAFELVRRFGNHRITQGFVAMQWLPQEPTQIGVCTQMSGAFDYATMVVQLQESVPPDMMGMIKVEKKDAEVTLTTDAGECKVSADRITTMTTNMRGKPRPEQAKQLLAMGDAGIRIVLPMQSKAWLGLAALQLPAAHGGEVTVTFFPEFVVRATITARDEDAAEQWVERTKALLTEYLPAVEAQLAHGEHAAALADLLAALKAITVRADGKTAIAELTGKTLGWTTVEALLRSSYPD